MNEPKVSSKLLNKLLAWHRLIAVVLLNTILLFVVINALAYVFLKVRHSFYNPNTPLSKYSDQALAEVYPEYNQQERKAILSENWSRGYAFDSYLLVREIPYQGKYLNVSAAGFRLSKSQGPWPPDPANINVFLFGGSTAFGYGVADDETIASYLQEDLARYTRKRLCVYNFGAATYYSTQERILFERLLTQGHKPDIAIFVDGLNEFWRPDDEPMFSDTASAALQQQPGTLLLKMLPMSRILQKTPKLTGTVGSVDPKKLRAIWERYQVNVKLIQAVCRELGIAPVFVWQPIPSYKYDTKYHLFWLSPEDYQYHAQGYSAMEALSVAGFLGTNFLWCADLQQDEKECVYVDVHHYTAKFSRKLADAVCRMSLERGLLKPAGLEPLPGSAQHRN